MRTHAISCVICERRFALAASQIPAQPTCSRDCKDALNRRRANHRRLVAWSTGTAETASQTTPNRASAALRDTRAAVAQLLSEGRRALRLIEHGEPA